MALSLSELRRYRIVFFLILAFVSCSVFVFVFRTSMSQEQPLLQNIAELQLKLQNLDSMYRERNDDFHVLSQHLEQLLTETMSPGNNLTDNIPASLSPEAKTLLDNMVRLKPEGGVSTRLLQPPSIYNFFPHLHDNPSSLCPALCLSKGRSGVSVVLGIPTVKRETQSYLLATLQNITDSMTKEEQDDTLIVVLIAETEEEYVAQIATDLKEHFAVDLESGLIDVVAPTAAYYPDLNKLRTTLGDSEERVKWRSKQNLDFAFLMMYAKPKGMFYVQLEDDIQVKPNFVTTMKTAALELITNKQQWLVLDFCELGFIGKMFHSEELPWLIQFFFMFYSDKPIDLLLYNFIHTKVCRLEKDDAQCKKSKDDLWIHYSPSLFQHVGIYSSLKGKVQELKDSQFGKVSLFTPHRNPEAEVKSDIKAFDQFTLKRAYQGETFFWGLFPKPDDHLSFHFNTPLHIKKYLFRSGNAEHASDRLHNTTVEVLPIVHLQNFDLYNTTSDGYVVIGNYHYTGNFDKWGQAEGIVPQALGAIKEIRLSIHNETNNWVILSEISVLPDLGR